MTKVFIDGDQGTTGLRIHERLAHREDIDLLPIAEEKRKDPDEVERMVAMADIAFFCLPDDAAREMAQRTAHLDTVIIDTSTAHRTVAGWSYGFAELSRGHREGILVGKRIAVPGCHASGFNALVYPLVKSGIIAPDYPLTCHSVTGYSGGGKKMIAQYEGKPEVELEAPRQYGLTQMHKHLKEMRAVPGLARDPVFMPIVADFYSGMAVTISLFSDLMTQSLSPEELAAFYAAYYGESKLISVRRQEEGMIAANALSGKDSMQIVLHGNEERPVVTALFDNLGKGASGAAVQCMNLIKGAKEDKGLDL